MFLMDSLPTIALTQVILALGILVTVSSTVLAFVNADLLTQWTFYCGARIVYNIYWHPLAKLPGPKLRASTFLPYYWALSRGIEPLTTKTFHEEYGHVVRINPNTLSFITAQAWKDIYGLRSGKVQLQKNTILAQRGVVEALSVIKDDVEHARVRALISPAFSERAVREQESLVMSFVDLLIQRLKTQVKGPMGGEVDLVQWYNFATFDIIGDLSLGQSFDSLKAGKYHVWITNIFGGIKKLTWTQIVQAYPVLEALMHCFISLFPSVLEGVRVHREYTKVAVQKRLATKTEKKDFISFFSHGLTDDELNENAVLLLLAGSETSATALSAATYYLLTHKVVLDKVCKEVRSAFHSKDEITFTSVSQLSYLNAVIAESFRIFPTVPSTQPRFSLPAGTFIDGRYIPGNTVVGVNQWAANRSKDNFRDPDKFIPERWLGDPLYADDQRSAVQPFSVGPRNCIGQTLAYAEIRSILARMLWHFDMELCEASKEWTKQLVFVLWEKPPLMVKLAERPTC